ncbi:MAG: hypothetical protein NT119_08065, partial [Actinobacteria bacterium]|nr:hypothetical protein [Actinomycetota bacterium]
MSDRNTNQDRIAVINAQIVTVDTKGSVIENGSLVIGADGAIREIASGKLEHTAAEVIDARGA